MDAIILHGDAVITQRLHLHLAVNLTLFHRLGTIGDLEDAVHSGQIGLCASEDALECEP